MEVLNISSKELEINESIKDSQLRVIGSKGEQLGIMTPRDAMELASKQNLDLVKVAPKAIPPVCKIMNYGKYRFEQAQKEKEAKKNQKVSSIKEVRLSLNIDVHDFETKVRNSIKFIKAGDKVKVTIRFRGREAGHPGLGEEVMERFANACQEAASVEKPAKLEGRNMIMFLAPKTK